MLIETASTSILVSIIRKGKIKNLQNVFIHGWYLLFIASLLQLILKMGYVQNFFYPIMMTSYILILICLGLNYKSKPMLTIFTGTLMNTIVIAANDGLMPVSIKGLAWAGYDISTIVNNRFDAFHSIITDATHLSFLADIIPIPEPYPFPQMLSIGDLFIMVGVFMFIQNAIVKKAKPSDKQASLAD